MGAKKRSWKKSLERTPGFLGRPRSRKQPRRSTRSPKTTELAATGDTPPRHGKAAAGHGGGDRGAAVDEKTAAAAEGAAVAALRAGGSWGRRSGGGIAHAIPLHPLHGAPFAPSSSPVLRASSSLIRRRTFRNRRGRERRWDLLYSSRARVGDAAPLPQTWVPFGARQGQGFIN